MTHDLRLIAGPEVFGYVAWVCNCGHRSESIDAHDAHVAERGQL